LVWQGNPAHPFDRERSFCLQELLPFLLRMKGIQLFSLQKGVGVEQLQPSRDSFEIKRFDQEIDFDAEGFMDTAAVLKNLDLLITADTAVAHLAGALDVPTWMTLPIAPDWRWGLSGKKTDWYPRMRLYRQNSAGEWHGVFERISLALRHLLQ
jgi:hypothetical protein